MVRADVLAVRLGLKVVAIAAAPAVDEDGALLLVDVEVVALHVGVAVARLLPEGADVRGGRGRGGGRDGHGGGCPMRQYN